MIITKISRLGTYVGVNPHFATLIDFLEKTGLENLTEGSIAIDGNRLFGNCFTYLADGQAGDFFETHQKYLDIHLVLENEEAMAVTSPENVSVTQEYDEEKDIELYTGKVEQLVHLRAGECLITFPEDLHQPKVHINDEPVKKLSLKLRFLNVEREER